MIYLCKPLSAEQEQEKLLEAAKEFALENGAKGVKLQTEIDNLSAQRLYAENGYLRDNRYFHYELTF